MYDVYLLISEALPGLKAGASGELPTRRIGSADTSSLQPRSEERGFRDLCCKSEDNRIKKSGTDGGLPSTTFSTKSGAGFTLMEVILTLGILAILAVVTVAFSRQGSTDKELTLAVETMVSVLRDVQQRAITQRDGKRWGAFFEDRPAGSADRFQLFSDTYLAANVESTRFLTSLLTFDSSAAGWSGSPPAKEIIFRQRDGLPLLPVGDTNSVIIIKTADGSRSRTITVTADGTITY